MTEANHLCNHAYVKHQKAIQDLDALKEKLWRGGETQKWGITDINVLNELTHIKEDK